MKQYKKRHFTELWNIIGSFDEISRDATVTEESLDISSDQLQISARIKKSQNGVYSRADHIKNISSKSITLTAAGAKFALDGGEWEVYTQYNGWQNESLGGWSPLVSSVVSRSNSVRSSHDAAPFMALYNKQNGRGIAFHLLTGTAWQMRASRVYSGGGEGAYLEIECGILPDGFCFDLKPGEELTLPEIVYYEFKNRVDFDCYKLHSYLNERIGKRELPVVYNTWLYKFDSFNYEDIFCQLKRAAELGVEYFVIDAGWFGKTKEWFQGRGDWCENTEIGFKGRMKEFADEVRANGMKFGFWLEPECASDCSDIMKEHPEYFRRGKRSYFLDFTNPDAFDYIFNKTSELIEYYGAEYIKFDFNADLEYDKDNAGFVKYAAAHEKYAAKLKERFPSLYLCCCGSGGARMNIHEGEIYDSFWPSDNESPYVGLDIYKNTLLRLSPQLIDCWIAIASVKGATPTYECSDDKIIACADAIWDNVVSVRPEFLRGYLMGSPIGLSFDLNSLSDESFEALRSYIKEFKQRREFYRGAVCHLLADTETVTALEYRSEDYSVVEVILFVKKRIQDDITLYPSVDKALTYVHESGKELMGGDIEEYGIDIPTKESFSATIIRMRAKEK